MNMDKTTNLKLILDVLEGQGIDCVTFNAHTFDEEVLLSSDDKDYVTFHKEPYSPAITDQLYVCDTQTSSAPVYRDWYMTINYHS